MSNVERFGCMLAPEYVAAMNAAGVWPNRLLTQAVDEFAAQKPDRVAVTDNNSVTGRSTTLSYRQLRRYADRIALGLRAHGVGHGDVVAFQLPNWWQFIAVHLACVRLGAVSNPLMPIFRERELEYMLAFAATRIFIVPQHFRGFDHGAMAHRLKARLPDLEHVFVLGSRGADSFEATFLQRRWETETDPAVLTATPPSPDDVIELQYTSGTTGQPKGVLHTSNTLLSNIVLVTERLGLSEQDVILMASPMAHRTGFLYGMALPLALGARTVLQDVWRPEVAARLIHDEGVTFTMGATPFLADLSHTDALDRYDIGSLRIFISAGAPIPRVLVQTATQRLGASVVSGWGMTENGLVTTTRLDDPPEKVFETDGIAIRGFEVRVVDVDGAEAATGEEGDLQVRGAGQTVGYMKRPELYRVDAEGWFDTGDRARMDPDGHIRITGRSKDIIIRGGENVPVVEVEELLYRHPAVRDAAVVGVPDERLGERGCAVITLKDGAGLSFQEMVDFLAGQHIARNYLPERLEIVEEMPRTPSGKIQKFRLREMLGASG